MFDLKGKKALITGAAGGIGGVIAKKFVEQGVIVGLSGLNKAKLDDLGKKLGGKTYSFECDLSNTEATEKLFDTADAEMGGVDILISNAGLTKDMLAMRMTNAAWDIVLNINLRASFILNRAAIKKMMKRRWGRIINMASVVGVAGNAGQANYVASKAGLIGMSKSIAMEVGTRGITVNCVAPGFIKSAMTDVLTDAQKSRILQNIPMGEMGTPEDIANAVSFLATEEARYITGQTIHVNGGMVMI